MLIRAPIHGFFVTSAEATATIQAKREHLHAFAQNWGAEMGEIQKEWEQ